MSLLDEYIDEENSILSSSTSIYMEEESNDSSLISIYENEDSDSSSLDLTDMYLDGTNNDERTDSGLGEWGQIGHSFLPGVLADDIGRKSINSRAGNELLTMGMDDDDPIKIMATRKNYIVEKTKASYLANMLPGAALHHKIMDAARDVENVEFSPSGDDGNTEKDTRWESIFALEKEGEHLGQKRNNSSDNSYDFLNENLEFGDDTFKANDFEEESSTPLNETQQKQENEVSVSESDLFPLTKLSSSYGANTSAANEEEEKKKKKKFEKEHEVTIDSDAKVNSYVTNFNQYNDEEKKKKKRAFEKEHGVTIVEEEDIRTVHHGLLEKETVFMENHDRNRRDEIQNSIGKPSNNDLTSSIEDILSTKTTSSLNNLISALNSKHSRTINEIEKKKISIQISIIQKELSKR